MLTQLEIKEFAIIEHSTIEFKNGFNVLSGETGAGKSILIDAISLLLGGRADANMVRHGAQKADIQAYFTQPPASIMVQLEEKELQDDENPQLLHIRRIIREKGNKTFINSQSTTTQTLKDFSSQLINIHGQHANQALLQNSEQRRRLDRYGKLNDLCREVAQAQEHWLKAQKKLQQWQEEKNQHQEKLALMHYQLEEFSQIQPKEGEFEEINLEHQNLAQADTILRNISEVIEILEDGTPNINSLMRQILQQNERLCEIHPRFQESLELLQQAQIYLQEAYDSLNHAQQRTEHNPEKLQILDERMALLHQLARKHHIAPETLHLKYQTLQEEYSALKNLEEKGDAYQEIVNKAEKDYMQLAEKLSQARQKAAQNFAQDVLQWIKQLGMEKAQFSVEIKTDKKISAHGFDEVQFLLCANPGQQMQALTKVASGGELSRISLAIEVACLDDNAVPHTLIFDEIDAGIGGEIADTIGKMLAKLSQTRQVLCITHLPQVAIYAHQHYRIEKQSDDKSTKTQVIQLDHKARIIEIARMLGDAESASSREHAKNMLKRGQSER